MDLDPIRELARSQHNLVTRAQARGLGLSDRQITRLIAIGEWPQLHRGVMLLGLGPPTWPQRVRAALLAGGPEAVASHRCGFVVCGLDGIERAPVEIMVPHPQEARLDRVLVHRSRRLTDRDVSVRSGIPIARVERVLIDAGRFVPEAVIEKGMESAIRRGLTTDTALWAYLEERGRDLPGWRRLRRVLALRTPGRAGGSVKEVDVIRALREHGVPEPVRQFELHLGQGVVFNLDIAWPWARVGIEWHSYEHHGGSRRVHMSDQDRRNILKIAGWDVLEYSLSALSDGGRRVVAETLALLHAAHVGQ